MTAPKFTVGQRNGLRQAGASTEQICSLEKVLPLSRALLLKPATLTDVREHLADVERPLHRAQKAMAKIVKGLSPACVETRNRIDFTESDLFGLLDDLPIANKAFEAMNGIAEILDQARRQLPTTQRRRSDANPLPIQLIERALLKGFLEQHAGGGLPAYEFETSRTKKAPFLEITNIFYQALGLVGTQDRAIRNYLELKKKNRRSVRRNIKVIENVTTAESLTYGGAWATALERVAVPTRK